MKSRTKYEVTEAQAKRLFEEAGIGPVQKAAPLGAGEYNAVFSVTAGGREYVLKIAPREDVPVLTYEKNMMEAELFWYEQIREHTSIRVPEIYFKDFSKKLLPAPYFIMEKLSGCQLNQMKFSPEEKGSADGQTAKMAAQIHQIKNSRFGYIQNELYDDWYQAVRSMVKALINDCAAKNKKTRRGEKLLSFIDKNKAVLEKAECTMVNFDINPANILCERKNGTVVYSWIDPERSFWGDRIFDFACLEMMTPFEKKKESLRVYNSVADKQVHVTREEQIRYGVALGLMGLIMATEKYYRYSPFHFGWWRNIAASSWFYRSAFQILKQGN